MIHPGPKSVPSSDRRVLYLEDGTLKRRLPIIPRGHSRQKGWVRHQIASQVPGASPAAVTSTIQEQELSPGYRSNCILNGVVVYRGTELRDFVFVVIMLRSKENCFVVLMP